jgi:multidrug transporter EmrE-like cation transporter
VAAQVVNQQALEVQVERQLQLLIFQEKMVDTDIILAMHTEVQRQMEVTVVYTVFHQLGVLETHLAVVEVVLDMPLALMQVVLVLLVELLFGTRLFMV